MVGLVDALERHRVSRYGLLPHLAAVQLVGVAPHRLLSFDWSIGHGKRGAVSLLAENTPVQPEDYDRIMWNTPTRGEGNLCSEFMSRIDSANTNASLVQSTRCPGFKKNDVRGGTGW